MNDLTAEGVRELLTYDPATGALSWTAAERPRRGSSVAGTKAANGYVMIRLKGRLRLAHRLAWLLHYGQWPQHGIDHINGDSADNRIENLRDVPQEANARNRRTIVRARYIGAVRNGDAWDAVAFQYGETRMLGTFATAAEANAAYLKHQATVGDPMRPRPKVKPPPLEAL